MSVPYRDQSFPIGVPFSGMADSAPFHFDSIDRFDSGLRSDASLIHFDSAVRFFPNFELRT